MSYTFDHTRTAYELECAGAGCLAQCSYDKPFQDVATSRAIGSMSGKHPAAVALAYCGQRGPQPQGCETRAGHTLLHVSNSLTDMSGTLTLIYTTTSPWAKICLERGRERPAAAPLHHA